MVRRAPRAGDYERAGAAARGRTSCSSADGRPVFSAALARAGRGVRASFRECLRARAQRGAARRGDGGGNASRARQARPAGEKTRYFLVGLSGFARPFDCMDRKLYDAERELSRYVHRRAALADERLCGYSLVALRARRFRRLPARRKDHHAPGRAVPPSRRAAPGR